MRRRCLRRGSRACAAHAPPRHAGRGFALSRRRIALTAPRATRCHADARDSRERKREQEEKAASSGRAGGAGTLPESGGGGGGGGTRVVPLNSVPKDEDILGGADGKTFTTHSKCVGVQRSRLLACSARCASVHLHLQCVLTRHRRRYKTSEMYARIREERGTN